MEIANKARSVSMTSRARTANEAQSLIDGEKLNYLRSFNGRCFSELAPLFRTMTVVEAHYSLTRSFNAKSHNVSTFQSEHYTLFKKGAQLSQASSFHAEQTRKSIFARNVFDKKIPLKYPSVFTASHTQKTDPGNEPAQERTGQPIASLE